ncbi:MAG: hypothetical protein K0Q59_3206 [Paenibacillus sp.]|jgi:hypothetical protein|nr:hypothetical protein [Paenibacillus sp.]
MGVRAIITGVTGMVGEGVMHECLNDPEVELVTVLTRKSCGITHPKLREVIHADFWNIAGLEQELRSHNACFFCLGVSSVGMSEADYTRITYDLTLHIAGLLSEWNPQMVFCYVTGSGTDSTEQGKSMWARVKGKTENDLLKLPFKQAYMFRPGYIHPTKGLTQTHKYYFALSWLYPLLKPIFPNSLITLKQLGKAMIRAATTGYVKPIVEARDILALAAEKR